MEFVFTNKAKKKFLKLDKSVQTRITEKLQYICRSKHSQSAFYKLKGFDIPFYKIRAGGYRLIFKKESKDRMIIADIGHRREIYRG